MIVFSFVMISLLACNQNEISKEPTAMQPKEVEFTFNREGLPDSLTNEMVIWMEIHPISDLENTKLQARKSLLFSNGDLYYWDDSRRVFVNDKPTSQEAPIKWRLSAKINQKGLTEITQKLNDVDFSKLKENSSGNSSELYFKLAGKLVYTKIIDGLESYTYNLFTEINRLITTNIISEGVPYEQE